MFNHQPGSARRRAGFTLVEVALAVAVGLIILGGAIMGYNAVKDNAASSYARRKVNIGAGLLAEYAAANFGRFPVSVDETTSGGAGGEFSAMWKSKLPLEYNTSPWGGSTGDASDGVTEYAPITTTGTREAPVSSTAIQVNDGLKAANIQYVSLADSGYVGIQQLSNPDETLIKNYCLAIFDRTGQPWFHLATNK